MDSDNNELTDSSMIDTSTDVNSSHLCKVCGNPGAQMNYGAECCPPCKMFFRRNFQFDLHTNQCVFDGQCDVTMKTRGACRFCRLKKCLSVGLERELIRGSHTYQQKTSTNVYHKEIHSLPVVIPTLDLLRNDRSLLTTEQWSLFSNVIIAYDDKSPKSSIDNIISLQSAYPSKMRLKKAKDDFEHITSLLYVSVTPFMDQLPEFKSLSINDQTALIQRNIRSVGGLGGTLILRETDIYNNPYYCNGSLAAFGSRIINQAIKIIDQADINGLLLKLCLPLIVFSTCSDVLNPKFSTNNSEY